MMQIFRDLIYQIISFFYFVAVSAILSLAPFQRIVKHRVRA